MRPPIDDRAITIVRQNVPEFESRYLDLLELYGEDLTPEAVLNELAEFATGILADGDDEETLERVCLAIEAVAVEPGVDGRYLVAFCFFDQLPAFFLEAIYAYLHPVTETILERLNKDLVSDGGAASAPSLSEWLSEPTPPTSLDG